MFDRVCIRRPADLTTVLQPLDLGAIAEAMLFYGMTHVILDAGSIESLLHQVGPQTLIRLSKNDYVSLHYSNEIPTFPMAGADIAPQGASIASIPAWELDRRLFDVLSDMGYGDGRSRRFMRPLLTEIQHLQIDPVDFSNRVHADLQQESLLRQWVEAILLVVAPDYKPPEGWFISFHEDNGGFAVETNLEFSSITSSYQALMNSEQNHVSIGHLLLACASPEEDLIFARQFDSEVSLTPLESRLLALRGEALATAYDESLDRKSRLLDFELDDSKAIAKAVNTQAVDFRTVLDLVDKSRPFRKWLAGQPADGDLLKEYYKESTRGTWVDDLPVAAARWALVTGGSTAIGAAAAGPEGMALGAGVGLVDFVAGRLLGRRGPNHFLRRVSKALRA
jgi:hypothetical protein